MADHETTHIGASEKSQSAILNKSHPTWSQRNDPGAIHKARQGLGRPKKALGFQLATDRQNVTHLSIDAPERSTVPHTLQKRLLFLDLIIRRNKNQFRNQKFFRHLCLLRRSLNRLLKIHIELEKVSATQAANSHGIRQKFESEARLRGQRDLVEGHVREALVPECYVSFSELVADSQFANLGVALVGLLAEIAAGRDGVGLAIVQQEMPQAKANMQREVNHEMGQALSRADFEVIGSRPQVSGISIRETGEDQGEVVERMYTCEDSTAQEHGALEDDANFTRHETSEMDIEKYDTNNSILSRDSSIPEVPAGQAALHQEAVTSARETMSPQKDARLKNTKKKQKTNAIDDLFNGLM